MEDEDGTDGDGDRDLRLRQDRGQPRDYWYWQCRRRCVGSTETFEGSNLHRDHKADAGCQVMPVSLLWRAHSYFLQQLPQIRCTECLVNKDHGMLYVLSASDNPDNPDVYILHHIILTDTTVRRCK